MAAVTVEQLEVLSDLTEPDGLYEVVDGRIVEKSMGAYENWLAAVMFGRLDRYVEANSIGRAVIEMIFDLRPRVDRDAGLMWPSCRLSAGGEIIASLEQGHGPSCPISPWRSSA